MDDTLFTLTEPAFGGPKVLRGVESTVPGDCRPESGEKVRANADLVPPLAVRMRPATIDDLVGQDKLLAPGAPLRRLVGGGPMTSVILWGPPGTGKTTIAHLVAQASDRRFVAMSALNSGVKDVRASID